MRAELGEAAAWGVSEHLMASLIEVIDATSWRSVMPHAKKGWKPPKPMQVTRPMHHEPKPRKRRATVAEIVAMSRQEPKGVSNGNRR